MAQLVPDLEQLEVVARKFNERLRRSSRRSQRSLRKSLRFGGGAPILSYSAISEKEQTGPSHTKWYSVRRETQASVATRQTNRAQSAGNRLWLPTQFTKLSASHSCLISSLVAVRTVI